MQNVGFESEKEIERINSEINVSKERISNNEENYNRFDKEIEEIKNRNNELIDIIFKVKWNLLRKH